MEGIRSQGQVKEGKEGKEESSETTALRKKTLGLKIVVACLALGCAILVIFILAKSSTYFASMFSLGTEIAIKQYLRQNYSSLMALLYLSIFGFVIATADSILLFFKFTQKQKLLWFHLGYYLIFLICGCVALTNKNYKDYMTILNGRPITDPLCIAANFLYECLLAPSYVSYNSSLTVFFIFFNILFVAFTALYHYTAIILTPFETEVTKPEAVKANILNANLNNETFVSEMMDEYA